MPYALRQFLAILKKDFAIQCQYRIVTLNRFLLGPIIHFFTAALFYIAFFKQNPNLHLGEMNVENYVRYITIGFLANTYISTGYYFFSGKLAAERSTTTLPLLWMAACNKFSLIFGLCSIEFVRCFFLSTIALMVVKPAHALSFSSILIMVWGFLLMFLMGILLGTVRAFVIIVKEYLVDILDNLYVLYMFTACPYMPKSMLPNFLQPFIQLNPAYYGCSLIRSVWGGGMDIDTSMRFLFSSVVVGAFAWYLVLKVFRSTILEKSIA